MGSANQIPNSEFIIPNSPTKEGYKCLTLL